MRKLALSRSRRQPHSVELHGNRAIGQALATAGFAVELPDATQHCLLTGMLAVRLPTFAPPRRPTSAYTCRAELRDDDGLLELRYGSEHLADEHARGVFIRRRQVCPAVRGNHPNAEVTELCEQDLGHEQLACEPISTLDEHEADTVRADAFDQLAEAVTVVQVTGAGNTLVAALAGDLDSVASRVSSDRVARSARGPNSGERVGTVGAGGFSLVNEAIDAGKFRQVGRCSASGIAPTTASVERTASGRQPPEQAFSVRVMAPRRVCTSARPVTRSPPTGCSLTASA